jgi:hypothetical protein
MPSKRKPREQNSYLANIKYDDWKELTPLNTLYFAGHVNRTLSLDDFASIQHSNYRNSIITLIHNNDPNEYDNGKFGYEPHVTGKITFPSEQVLLRFAKEYYNGFNVDGSETLFIRLMMNTMYGTQHNIDIYCFNCDNVLCSSSSVFRILKDCIWTRKGAPVKLIDTGKPFYNNAKENSFVWAACSKCKKRIAHHYYDMKEDHDHAEYKILVFKDDGSQSVKIKGDQSSHHPQIYPESKKTNLEQNLLKHNKLVVNNENIQQVYEHRKQENIPVTRLFNREEVTMRNLFVKFSGVRMNRLATQSLDTFLVYLWQLSKVDKKLMDEWNLFQELMVKEFNNDVIEANRSLKNNIHKLSKLVSGKYNDKYQSEDEVKHILYHNMGFDPAVNHSNLFAYDPSVTRELYEEINADCIFVSIDLKHANYTATYLLDPELVESEPTFNGFLQKHNLPELCRFRLFRLKMFGLIEKHSKLKFISIAQNNLLDVIYYTICDSIADSGPLLNIPCIQAFKFSKDELLFQLNNTDIDQNYVELLPNIIETVLNNRLPMLSDKVHINVFKLTRETLNIPDREPVQFYLRKDLINPDTLAFKTVWKDILAPVYSHYLDQQQSGN